MRCFSPFYLLNFSTFFILRKRIAAASLRTGFAMTGFLHEVRWLWDGRPQGSPLRNGLQGRASGPHRTVSAEVFPVPPNQHKRGARRGIRRRDDAKARHKICKNQFAGQEGTGTDGTSAAERIPKPWVLAAFFPPFLSPQKEREPPEACTHQGI